MWEQGWRAVMKVQASHEWPGFKPWRRQHMSVESVVGSLI